MDLENIKSAVDQLTKDDAAKEALKKNPVDTIKNVLGTEVNEATVKSVVSELKKKLDTDGDGTPDLLDKLENEAKSLFGAAKAEGESQSEGILDKIKDTVEGLFSKE